MNFRLLCKLGVKGSNPLFSTNDFDNQFSLEDKD